MSPLKKGRRVEDRGREKARKTCSKKTTCFLNSGV
jgi:hypothetical protein